MKKTFTVLAVAGLGLMGSLFASSASAYSLNLPPAYPDVTTYSASVNYTATCVNDNGLTGVCGQSASSGAGGSNGRRYDVQTSGLLTITGTTMSLNATGSGSIAVTSGSQGLSYSLSAKFDANGNFVTSGSTISIKGVTTDPNFQSGKILGANLTQLGFAGGTGCGGGSSACGTFYFTFNNSVTGDMAAFYSNYSGVIAGTTNMTTGSSWNPVWTSGTWDPSNNNNPGFFLRRSFTATSNVDTFVPVPAAAWLFGSGLLGLVGVARRRATRD